MIDSRFIDVDLSVVPEGQGTGLIEETAAELLHRCREGGVGEIPLFSDEFPELLVPRSQWKERAQATQAAAKATTRHIYSQGNSGACVGFGIAQAAETLYYRETGIDTPLAGMQLYKRIGRTKSSGANISTGIASIVKDGVVPLDTPENKAIYPLTWAEQDYYRSLPAGWQGTSRLFRIAKWARCQGAEETFSALFSMRTGVVGRSRHCIPYTHVGWDSKYGFGCPYPNSWGSSWSDDGWGWDSERLVDSLTFYCLLEIVYREAIEPPKLGD